MLAATWLLGTGLYAQNCAAPVINSFTPNTGFIGSTVTIFGANFDANPANNQVFFGATQATVQSANFGTLTVTVPVGATLAPISVKNNCDKTAYSRVPFNGIFCPTPITAQTYNSTDFTLPAKGAYNMLAMDMDLDGKPDVISGGVSGGGFTIAHNQSTPGNLNFTRFDISSAGPQGHAIADFDGDGKMDICFTRSTIYYIANNSTPGNLSFGTQQTIGGSGGYQITIGDVNRDGKIDIIAGTGNNITTFLNGSTGPGNFSFSANTVVAAGARCTGLQAADIDGDGLVDIVATQGSLNRAVTFRNTTLAGDSVCTFEGLEAWPSNGLYPYRCMIADFDKDGKIDLTTCNFNGTANTAMYRNISTVGDIVFDTTINYPAPTRNYRIGVGDANGDGYPDVMVKSLGVNVFAIYENTSTAPGSMSFANRIDYTSSARAEVSGMVIADLDGDFVPDVATSGINSNEIRFHRNNSAQVDTVNPTAVCQDVNVALDQNGQAVVTASMVDAGSGNACGLDTTYLSKSMFTCADTGANSVTLYIVDNAGNMDSCVATVTVAPAVIIVVGQTTVCEGDTVFMSANTGEAYQWYLNGTALSGDTMQNYAATVSGSYTVAVTNTGGCSGVSPAVDAVVNDNPTVNTTPSGLTYLCGANNDVTLAASQSAIYQWHMNGTAIPGATQQAYVADSVGFYSVSVIYLFGCSALSDSVEVRSTNAEIKISGNNNEIVDGDTTPTFLDKTNIGAIFPNGNLTSTFKIENTGTGPLTITASNLSGPNTA